MREIDENKEELKEDIRTEREATLELKVGELNEEIKKLKEENERLFVSVARGGQPPAKSEAEILNDQLIDFSKDFDYNKLKGIELDG